MWFVDVFRVLWIPYLWLGNIVYALFGLVSPKSGRKLYASNERFATGGWAISAFCFQPRGQPVELALDKHDHYKLGNVIIRLATAVMLVTIAGLLWSGFAYQIPWVQSVLDFPFVQLSLSMHCNISLLGHVIVLGWSHLFMFIGVGGLIFCALALFAGQDSAATQVKMESFLKQVLQNQGQEEQTHLMMLPGGPEVMSGMTPTGVHGACIAVVGKGVLL